LLIAIQSSPFAAPEATATTSPSPFPAPVSIPQTDSAIPSDCTSVSTPSVSFQSAFRYTIPILTFEIQGQVNSPLPRASIPIPAEDPNVHTRRNVLDVAASRRLILGSLGGI